MNPTITIKQISTKITGINKKNPDTINTNIPINSNPISILRHKSILNLPFI
jgi:hypothetical protein